ncbi:MAG TPA: TonB-dependent receptor [Candidatus Krumholzibacteria bacterium]
MISTTLLASVAHGQASTTGAVEGQVVDTQGMAMPGVTVTISSTQGPMTKTTDADGRFVFAQLPAGMYTLKAQLQGFNTVQREDLDVRLGSRLRVDVVLTQGVQENIEVIGQAPIVDLSTTTTGATFSSEMMKSIPVGRSFSSTLALAPGVVSSGIPGAGDSNPSIGGASGLENVYVIDGVNINNTGYGSAGSYSIIFGSLGTGVNFDYIKEVQVKTGGYEPEYGEALGGFVNLVTKRGGNDFGGSVFGYFQGAEAERERSTRVTSSGFAAADVIEFESQDYGGEISGPIVKDKLFFYGAFDPTFTTRTGRTAQALAADAGYDHTLKADRTIWNYAGNLKWNVNSRNSITFSAFGDPSTGDMGPQRISAVEVEDPSTRYSEISFGGNNAAIRWESELYNNGFVEASYALHRDDFEEDLNVNLPNGTMFFDPATGDSLAVPRNFGGPGFYEDSQSTNNQWRLKFSNFIRGGGEHNLRYGVEYQDMGYSSTANYSGTPGLTIPVSDDGLGGITYATATTGFIWDVDNEDFRISRIRSGDISSDTNNHYLAFFLSDSYSPVKWINLMGGIRYEQQKVIGTVGEHTWDNNWAPRAHITVDPTRDNKTKLSLAYGRFFGKVPNDLAVRALSTEVTHVVRYPIENIDFSDPNNPRVIDPTNFNSFTTFGDEATVIDPDSKVSYQDEYVAGIEREIIPAFSIGVTYMHRQLGRTLEDVALVPYTELLAGADFGNYYITNPGPDILASNGQPGFPEPSRKYDSVTFKLDKRWRDNWQLAGSYTWSQLKGNYEGYFRRDNGQSDPFITSLFDFPYLATPEDQAIWQYAIEDGTLPNDRTHVFNLYGSYGIPMGERRTLSLGLSYQQQSGVPITALGFNEVYGNGYEIPLAPRGEGGTRLASGEVVPGSFKRGPTTYDVGVHADYTFAVGGQEIAAIFRVFNLFNDQKGTDFDQGFELNAPGDDSPDFGKAVSFQSPRRFQFALRTNF